MPTKKEIKWESYNKTFERTVIGGIKEGIVSLYSDDLLTKLRGIYDGNVPASLILLSWEACNGDCYEKAALLARAFLDTDLDVKLVYGGVNFLRLNPNYIVLNQPAYDDHCFVIVTAKDGKELVYDTSKMLCFDKDVYFKLEEPSIRKIRTKEEISSYIESQKKRHPEGFELDKECTVDMTYILNPLWICDNLSFKLNLGLLRKECNLLRSMYSENENSRQ